MLIVRFSARQNEEKFGGDAAIALRRSLSAIQTRTIRKIFVPKNCLGNNPHFYLRPLTLVSV